MKNNWIFNLILAAFASLLITTNSNAQVVVFSNDFEDGDLVAEVGSMTLVDGTSNASVVPVAGGSDPTLGSNIGLFDQLDGGTLPLDLTWNLTDPVSLADGNTVSVDFDLAARRTDGPSRTVFVDAMDSSGNIVVRLVLGDSGIFGNDGSDRQRPGFATLADGNMVFGTPPGSFWWGSDFNTDTFDVVRDGHISLTIGESSFEISTTRTNGNVFSAAGLSNYDTVASADIAEIRLTSFVPANGVVIYGIYFDNIIVEGIVSDVSPVVLGDCNLDGVVDFLDIVPFVGFLSSEEFLAQADVNEDGVVDFLDIVPFVEVLSAG